MTRCIARPRQLAYERQQGCCYYCGMPMWLRSAGELTSRFSLSDRQAELLRCTAEHLHARRDGGGQETIGHEVEPLDQVPEGRR